MRKQLIQRFSGLLYLHGDGDSLLLPRQRGVKRHNPLDHLHLLLGVTALQEFNDKQVAENVPLRLPLPLGGGRPVGFRRVDLTGPVSQAPPLTSQWIHLN